MSNSCLERLLIMGIKLKLYIFYSEKQAVYSLVKHSRLKNMSAKMLLNTRKENND